MAGRDRAEGLDTHVGCRRNRGGIPLLAVVLGLGGAAACNALWGVDELQYEPGGAGGSGTPTGSGGGTTTSSGTGGTATDCTPNDTRSCYTGPDRTLDVGVCHAGTETCRSDGSGWGPCVGEVTPGQEHCSTPTDDDCDGSPCETLWHHRFGGRGADYVQGVAVDSQQSTIITGSFSNTIDFGGDALTSRGGVDWFIAKFDAEGNHLWSKRYGETEDQVGKGVVVDESDNIVVVGYAEGSIDFGDKPLASSGENDVVIAKLDPDGTPIWSFIYGDAGIQNARSVAIDDDGNIAVVGNYYSDFDLGDGAIGYAGGSDIFVGVFDADGGHVWSGGFGSIGDQYIRRVAFDVGGDVLLAGGYSGEISFGGPTFDSVDGYDMYLAQLTPTGGHLWSDSYGDMQDQYFTALAPTPIDTLVAVGRFTGAFDLGGRTLTSAGAEDAFVAHFSGDGQHLASESYGSEGMQRCEDVAVDSTGLTLVVGSFVSALDVVDPPLEGDGADDVFLVQFDSAGHVVFATSFPVTGAPDPALPDHIPRRKVAAVNADDAFVVAGFYYGTLSIDGELMPSQGDADIFVTKLR